jgi:hypothetical protein
MAAIALVASLGLIVPSSFGGPASADVSNKNPQPMSIECDLDGNDDTGDHGYEYVSDVIAIDHDPGGKKLGKMQDTNSNLQFLPVEGSATTIWTAIEDNRYWPGDSSPFAAEPLSPEDAATRLADYPAVWETPPGYPFSYFGEGFSTHNAANENKSFVDCVVTDVGLMDAREALSEMGTTQCLRNGVLQDLCFENKWVADDLFDVEDSKPCLVEGVESDKCMRYVPDDPDTDVNEEVIVTYHYTDIITIKAQVTGNNGANVKAASADDDAATADRQVKSKKGDKHRGKGKGKRGR